ncbi:hypothetical protein AK812_SmicGene47483, partial [Symbiodinium microadriaticum]
PLESGRGRRRVRALLTARLPRSARRHEAVEDLGRKHPAACSRRGTSGPRIPGCCDVGL